jgi:multiple sugar transport system ATP-binding protein
MARIELRDVSLKYVAGQPVPKGRSKDFLAPTPPNNMPVKGADGVMALDHVNLIIPHGWTFVILGPSGCGKSSLLRVVAGIHKDYQGQVFYDGEPLEEIPARERFIGMVFQNYALYPNFNNEGNLSFFFKLRKTPDEETRERIRYTSELMGIGFNELLPRKPGTLSGGQKQRVALARAIVRQPRLFLLDEPLSNLDAKLRVQTRTEIKRLLQHFKITSIYVTHDQTEAIALADQIVIMRAGKIEQMGAYQEIMANPVNAFVAGFLGLPPMNLFSGGLASGDRLSLDGISVPLPGRVADRVHTNQSVTLGMRPEAVSISTGKTAPDGIIVSGQVEAIEPDFAHQTQLVYLRHGRWKFCGFCTLDHPLVIGQSVEASLDPERLYFFDEETELRLG